MLVAVAPLPLSFPPSLRNIGILQYKQAKLRKHLQHSVLHKNVQLLDMMVPNCDGAKNRFWT